MNPFTKVIFLDFDGVILTPRAARAARASNNELDPVAVTTLAALGTMGVQIVVSSSWRTLEDRCREVLRTAGLEQFLHADWRTRDSRHVLAGGKLDRRGHQIADWLAQHPEVRSYRILDDSDEMLPLQSPFFVLCHAYDGLGYYAISRLLDWASEKEAA